MKRNLWLMLDFAVGVAILFAIGFFTVGIPGINNKDPILREIGPAALVAAVSFFLVGLILQRIKVKRFEPRRKVHGRRLR